MEHSPSQYEIQSNLQSELNDLPPLPNSSNAPAVESANTYYNVGNEPIQQSNPVLISTPVSTPIAVPRTRARRRTKIEMIAFRVCIYILNEV